MSIRQFRTFTAICERGSFAEAAKAVNLTQSAVGMQVAALEHTLGVTLFDRKHRPPRLTSAGEIVLRRARNIVAQYDSLSDALSATRSYRGSFRLGVIPTVLTNLLPAALVALVDREPGLTLTVVSELSGVLLRQVEQGRFDAALMHKPNHLHDGLAWRDIAQQRIMVVAPPNSTQETAEEALGSYPYIRFNRAAWVAPLIEQRLGSLGIETDTRAEIQSIEAIHLMIRLGFGVSILPDVGGAGGSVAPLRVLDFGSPPIHRTIGLLSRKDNSRRNARRIVGDTIVEVAGRHDWPTLI